MSESICSCDLVPIAIKIAIVILSSMKGDDLHTPQTLTYPLIYLVCPHQERKLPNFVNFANWKDKKCQLDFKFTFILL